MLMANEGKTPKNAAPRPFAHFMLREIYEQPEATRKTLEHNVASDIIFVSALRPIENALFTFKKIIMAASGSSRNAGLAGEIMMEDLAGVAVDVEYSSEYCLRSTHAGDSIVVVITQSGETADTIAAQREGVRRGAKTRAISNVTDSTIAQEAGITLVTYAAPECAVPATKSFTAQLSILYLFALSLAHESGRISGEVVDSYLNRLSRVPSEIEKELSSCDSQAAKVARFGQDAKAV